MTWLLLVDLVSEWPRYFMNWRCCLCCRKLGVAGSCGVKYDNILLWGSDTD